MQVRRIALALVCAAGLGLVGLGQATAPPKLPDFQAPDLSKATACPVLRVVDGDTIIVDVDGKDVKVRLVGIDTPETVDPRKPVQEYSKEASRFTANLLKGEKVWLLPDPQGDKIDKYGRTLAYVYRAPDGLFVNAEIIRQGYGHAYTLFPFRYLTEFRQLEQFARQAEKGLWGPEVKQPAQAIVEPHTVAPAGVPPVVAPPVVQPQPKVDAGDAVVFVTRTGQKYHRADCRYLAKSSIPMKLRDAKVRYGPCSVCNPPQ